jgi:ribosomal protein S18 acetylase RimI-like enzyme
VVRQCINSRPSPQQIMQVTVPFPKNSLGGLRPINLNTDIPQVLRLLEFVFEKKLDADGRSIFLNSAQAANQPALLWRLNPATSRLALGYVWEIEQRIIGNVTILTTTNRQRFLVVNVAVHPDYRRRGIARGLMHKVNEVVRHRGGNQILLQVVKDNQAAVGLYEALNYLNLGSMCTWNGEARRLRPLEPDGATAPLRIRELRRGEWQQAYAFDRLCLHPDLNWPEPLQRDAFKTGWLHRIGHFLNGRSAEHWVLEDARGQFAGLGSLITEYGRSHLIAVRVHPEWREAGERPLLAKLIRRLRALPTRRVTIIHPDEDETMNNLLQESNFSRTRVLTHMRLDL